jgi:hypothetical protein
MRKIVKKGNSRWILLFLFALCSIFAHAQPDENQKNNWRDTVIGKLFMNAPSGTSTYAKTPGGDFVGIVSGNMTDGFVLSEVVIRKQGKKFVYSVTSEDLFAIFEDLQELTTEEKQTVVNEPIKEEVPCDLKSCPAGLVLIKCFCEPQVCSPQPVCTGNQVKVGCSCIEKLKPCEQIEGLLKYDFGLNNSMKKNMQDLVKVVNSGSNTIEHGFEVTRKMNFAGGTDYNIKPLKPGDENSIPVKESIYNVGDFHSHPFNALGLYSFADMKHLLGLYDYLNDAEKQKAFIGLVSPSDNGTATVYILKIDNIDALRATVRDIWNNPQYKNLQDEDDRTDEIHEDMAKKITLNNWTYEQAFFNMFGKSGVSIYKANNTLDKFNNLNPNNSVPNTPCN